MDSSTSIPTLHFPQSIFSEDFKDVYEPAEDSFILLDALEADLETIRKTTSISLECGSGSGIITTALSKILNSSKSDSNQDDDNQTKNSARNVLMLATDINELACRTTLKCSNLYKQDNHLHVVCTNLANGLLDRLLNQIDLLIFNPPYVPTEEGEKIIESDSKIDLSWAGGPRGRDIVDVFMKKYVPKLLSKPDGQLYLVALEQNNIQDLLTCVVDDFGIKGEIVLERKCGIERLFVLRFRWISSS